MNKISISEKFIEKNFEKFKIIKQIGRGGFSFVYLGKNELNEHVIIKQIKNNILSDNEIRILLEIQEMSHVIQLKKICYYKTNVLLITNFLPKTIDLFEYITEKKKLSEELSKNIFLQLLTIIKNLSMKKIYHNDIKDENILINYETQIITLIDFGAATFDENDLADNTTLVYSSPEWLKYKLYLKKEFCIWSLGILLFTMVCGDIPFHSHNEIINLNQKSIDEKINQKPLSNECKNFLIECLQIDYDQRMTLENISNHNFLC
jgi:serine/threonine protein kinase